MIAKDLSLTLAASRLRGFAAWREMTLRQCRRDQRDAEHAHVEREAFITRSRHDRKELLSHLGVFAAWREMTLRQCRRDQRDAGHAHAEAAERSSCGAAMIAKNLSLTLASSRLGVR